MPSLFEIKEILKTISDDDLLYVSRRLDAISNALIFICLPIPRAEWLVINFTPVQFSEIVKSISQISCEKEIVKNLIVILRNLDSTDCIDDVLARKLQKFNSYFSEKILSELKNDLPDFFEKVIKKQSQYVQLSDPMEILSRIDDRGIQRLLSDLDTASFGIALIFSSEFVKEKIRKNVTKNRWEMISQEFLAPGHHNNPAEIKKRQTEIMLKIRRLEKDGEIIIEGRKIFLNANDTYEPT